MRRTLLAGVILISLSLIASTPANQVKKKKQQPSRSVDKALNAKEIYARFRSAVVQIKTKYHEDGEAMVGTGCGFFCGAPDFIVTAYHVIDGAESIDVVNAAGVKFPIKKISFDVGSDVAIMFLTRPTSGPVLLSRLFGDVAVGETAFAIGNPLGLFPDTISQGIISGKRKLDGIPCLQMTAAISHGNSGGPLFDDRGRVIGIVDALMTEGQNNNLAIAMNQVVSAIKSSKWVTSEQFCSANKILIKENVAYPDSTFRAVKDFETPPVSDELTGAVLSPSGEYLVYWSDRHIWVMSLAGHKVVHEESLDTYLHHVRFRGSDDAVLIFTDGQIRMRACSDWSKASSVQGKERFPGATLSPDGRQLYYTYCKFDKDFVGSDWKLKALDLTSGESREILNGFGVEMELCLGADGARMLGVLDKSDAAQDAYQLAILGFADNKLTPLRDVSWKKGAALEGSQLYGLALSADGNVAAALIVPYDPDGQPHLETYNASSGLLKRSYDLPFPRLIDEAGFISDGKRYVVASPTSVYCVDLSRGAFDFKMDRNGTFSGDSISFAKSGELMSVVDGKRVRLYSFLPEVSYLGKWEFTLNGLKYLAEFQPNGAVSYTYAIPEKSQVIAHVLGTWKDSGAYVSITFTDVNFDNCPAEWAKYEKDARDQIKKAHSTRILRTTWRTANTFEVAAEEGKTVLFTRKT